MIIRDQGDRCYKESRINVRINVGFKQTYLDRILYQ